MRFIDILGDMFLRLLQGLGGIRQATYEQLPQSLGSAPQSYASDFSNLLGNLSHSNAAVASAAISDVGTLASINERNNENLRTSLNSTISNLPQNLVQAKQWGIQLPVMEANAQTALQEQSMIQTRLKNLQNPGMFETINGTNLQVAPSPMPFGGANYYGSGGTGSGGTGGTGGQTGDQTANAAQAPTAPSAPLVLAPPANYQNPAYAVTASPAGAVSQAASPITQLAVGHGISGQYPNVPAAPSAQTTQPTTSSTVPPNVAAVTSPANVLDYYQNRIDTSATSARAEMNPVTGLPTGRSIVSFKNKPDQVVHPAHPGLAMTSGTWSPPGGAPVGSNAALALPPAAATVASAPIAQGISNQLAQNVGVPAAPVGGMFAGAPVGYTGTVPANNPPAVTAMINQQGGPLVAQTGPGGPLPSQAPQDFWNQVRSLNAQRAPVVAAPSAPVAATPVVAGNAPVVDMQNHPAIAPVTDQEQQFWRDHFGGATIDAVRTAAGTPKNVSMIGPAASSPNFGYRVMNTSITMPDGKAYDALIDTDPQTGRILSWPYLIQWSTPYMEHRIMANNQTYDIENSLGKEEDETMMRDSMKAGTVSGNWQSLSRDAKIAAYKQAQTLLNYAPNDDASKREFLLSNAIDKSNEFLNLMYKWENANPDDPQGMKIRNVIHQAWSDQANRWGPALDDVAAHFGMDPKNIRGDPLVSQLRRSYQELQNSADAYNSTIMPTRTGPNAENVRSIALATGDFNDPNLPALVRDYMGDRATDLAKWETLMIGNHYRTNLDAMYKSNLVLHRDDTPGSNPNVPFHPPSDRDKLPAYYDKLPLNSYYQVPGEPVYQKRFKTYAEAMRARTQAGQ
jgi:hypothetical protein